MAFKYKAFISYSHQDAEWGTWLHKALETYSVPRSLVGTDCRDGSVPKRLFPIFRDREELPTATDLGAVISQALNDSGYLVVICSPRSAKSLWVNEEILSFKRLGRENRILAIIVDGEPNAGDKPDIEAEECFPEALKYKIGTDGNLTKERTEPIAADARPGKDGKEAAKLKLLAGLLGVSFDSLNQREKKRQKAQRLMASAAMVLALVFGTYFYQSYEEKRIAGLVAESESLTLEAIEQLDAGDSKGALTNLLKALPVDVDNPERPILEKTKTVLNRAVFTHRELISFQGPAEEIKEINPLKNGQLMAITQSGDTYIYNQDGGLVHQFIFEDEMGIYVTKDEKILVAASFVQREEKGEEEFASSTYPQFFVSKSFNLETGKIIRDFEKRYEGNGPSKLFYFRGKEKHFFDDGKGIIGELYDNSGSEGAVYKVAKVDVATGNIIAEVGAEKFISETMVTMNGTVISRNYDVNAKNRKQLDLYFAKSNDNMFSPLRLDNDFPACKNGQPISFDEMKGERLDNPTFALSEDENHVVVIVDDIEGYDDWCVVSFDLTTGEKSQMFTTNISELLETGLEFDHQAVLELAYNSFPPLLHLDNRRRIQSTFKNRIFAKKVQKSGVPFYAYAVDSTVNIKGVTSVSLSNEGVNVTAMAFNQDASQLWIAGIDGRVRLLRASDEMDSFNSHFDTIDKIHVGSKTLTVINKIYLDEGQRTFDLSFIPKSGEGEINTLNFPFEEDINHVDTKLYGLGTRLGIMKNRHVGFSVNREGPKPAYWLHVYDLETGKEVFKIQHNMGAYNFPTGNETHLAYTFEEKVYLVSLLDGAKTEISIPDGLHTYSAVFIGQNLLISTFDNRDDPNTRKSALFLTDDQGVAPLKKIAEKQAQGLTLEPNATNGAILLRWDIDYQTKLLEVITHDATIHSVNQTWEEEFGLSYLLSENGDIIYGVQDNKSVTQYGLNGAKINERFSNQSWFGARLGPTGDYLINRYNFLSLSDIEFCGSLEFNGTILDDYEGRYLVVGDIEKTQIYDLKTCQIMRVLPFNGYSEDSIHLDRDGSFWLVNQQAIYKIKTQSSFLDNIKTANRIMSGDKK